MERLLKWLARGSPAEAAARLAEVQARVRLLSTDEAMGGVEALLRSGELFRAEPADGTHTDVGEHLPPIVYQLFQKYSYIETNSMRVARSDIGPLARNPEFMRIGSDLEHADVVVRPAAETVYVCEDDGSAELDLEDAHPTVWHYLMVAAETRRQLE